MHCHESSSQILEFAVPLSILSASFFGSAHCVGMCGGLVTSMSTSTLDAALYHFGRVLSYMALGALAGSLGASTIDLQNSSSWASLLGAISMGLLLIFMGQKVWLGKAPHPPGSKLMGQIFIKLSLALRSLGLNTFISKPMMGVVTILLPCGWLYSFVLGAAASGSALKGSLFMLLFGIGTLPSLLVTSFSFQKIIQKQFKNPRLAGSLLMAMGFVTLIVRLGYF